MPTELPVPAHPGPPGPPELRGVAASGGGTTGCLRWGLAGCTLFSVALIVSLIFMGMKAKSLLGWALARVEEQVLSGVAPTVSPEERLAFRNAYRGFMERAQASKVSPEEIRDFQKKVVGALADGTVTADELKTLTAAAGPVPLPKT